MSKNTKPMTLRRLGTDLAFLMSCLVSIDATPMPCLNQLKSKYRTSRVSLLLTHPIIAESPIIPSSLRTRRSQDIEINTAILASNRSILQMTRPQDASKALSITQDHAGHSVCSERSVPEERKTLQKISPQNTPPAGSYEPE